MHELRRRGEEAHDTDVECIRISRTTNEILNYVDAKKEGYLWIYPEDALRKLKELSAAKNVFLLGSIDNFSEVKEAADEFIWMTIPLDELIRRLNNRQKEYGKSERERKQIIELYETMSDSMEPETFRLDATKTVEAIADDLLAHVNRTVSSTMN